MRCPRACAVQRVYEQYEFQFVKRSFCLHQKQASHKFHIVVVFKKTDSLSISFIRGVQSKCNGKEQVLLLPMGCRGLIVLTNRFHNENRSHYLDDMSSSGFFLVFLKTSNNVSLDSPIFLFGYQQKVSSRMKPFLTKNSFLLNKRRDSGLKNFTTCLTQQSSSQSPVDCTKLMS